MDNNEGNYIFFERLAGILIRSFLLGVALLLLWFVLYLIAPQWIFEMNAGWFNTDKHTFDLINYFGIGFVKIVILLFFLFPYLLIKWALWKKT